MRSKTAFILMFASLTTFGATAQTPTPPLQQEVLEHWRRATISFGRLITENGVTRYSTLGSGVFVAFDQNHVCVLTAKHVVHSPQDGWMPAEIRMRLARNAATPDPDLGVNIPLTVNNQQTWRSIGETDLAVLPLPDLSGYSDLHAVSLGDFGASEDDVFQGAPVLVLGFPGLSENLHFLFRLREVASLRGPTRQADSADRS
jgi:hypothetical protein